MYARIVIDGGGTKTSAIMVDENNSQLAIAQGGPANINKFGKNLEEGAERIWEIIKDLIDKLCQDSKKDASSIERICFGLAGMGIGESEQKKAFTRILDKEKLLSKSGLLSDAEMQFMGNLPEGTGILVISGTGSIVLGSKVGSKLEKAGGWGPAIGDQGSGYKIGLNVLQHISLVLDEGREPSPFERAVLDYCKVNNQKQFRQWIIDHSKEPDIVAKLSELAQKWAVMKPNKSAGEKARNIIDGEIENLVNQVISLVRKLTIRKPRIVTTGGCFQGAYYKKRFKEIIKDRRRGVNLVEGLKPLEAGRKLLLKEDFWKVKDEWKTEIVPLRRRVMSAVIELGKDERLVLGIFGATQRWGAIVGRANGDALLALKGEVPLAYQAIADGNAAKMVFDKICGEIYENDARYLQQVRYIQISCSGAGYEDAKKMYVSSIRDSITPFTEIEPNEILVWASTDADAVFATELSKKNARISDQGGIVIMAGAGSIIFLKLPKIEGYERQGGYGAPFSLDMGSSYDIGFNLKSWLHIELDKVGWPEPVNSVPDYALSYLDAVLEHFVKKAVPGANISIQDIEEMTLKEKRDHLRYLPIKAITETHNMRAAIAELSHLACNILCPSPGLEQGSFLRRIKENAAQGLLGLFRELLERQKENIRNYLKDMEEPGFPVILEGGSFNCPLYRDIMKTGIDAIGKECKIPFSVIFSTYHPVIGAFDIGCDYAPGNHDFELIKKRAISLDLGQSEGYKHSIEDCRKS